MSQYFCIFIVSFQGETGEKIMNFLELAFAEDLTEYAEEMEVSVEELASHQADVREIAKLWAKVYPDSDRGRIDPKIWDKIQPVDLPYDTTLILARDIINKHLEGESQIRVSASLTKHGTFLTSKHWFINRLASLWWGILQEFENFPFHRLCAQCGKPFCYVSLKATYCSDACRTAASRRRRAG
jgi:hypothetical protein